MFSWLLFTTAFNAKMQRKAAAERQEKERLDRERIERNNRLKSMSEHIRKKQQNPYMRAIPSAPAARQEESTDLLNPINPLSPLSIWNSALASTPEPSRDCPAPSYEPDTSSRYDSCSSSSSDSGSNYDSGSSSSSSYD